MKQLSLLIKRISYIMNSQQRKLCFLVILMCFIGSILECLGVSAIIPIVEVIQEPEKLRNSILFKNNNILSGVSNNNIVLLVIGFGILVYLVKNSFFLFLTWVRAKFSSKVQRELSVSMMNSYMSRGYQFFLNKNYGELHRGVIGDTSSVYNALCALFKLFVETLTIILICSFMFISDWVMASMVVALGIMSFLVIYVFFRRSMQKTGEMYREYEAKSAQDLLHAFHGAKDIMVLKKQRYFVNAFRINKETMQKALCKQTIGMESPAYVIEGICISGLFLFIGIRILFWGVDDGFMAVLASFAVGAFRLLPSLGRISSSVNTLENVAPSVNILYDQIIEAEQYLKEHPESVNELSEIKSKWGLINLGCKEKNVMRGDSCEQQIEFVDKLELRDVSFRYDKEMQYVIKSVNLVIKKGQSVALIGTSGAGKSTLVDVILGLLVPQQGFILLDNKKITDIPDAWAQIVGYVPQSVFLTDESIEKNVAFGEDYIDRERVWSALIRAGLKDFVDSLPLGVETIVGDRGVRMSGGQRQRIAIARALYHKPQILILDEATSALDNETENTIMSEIELLHGEVTMIIVAHRLSTVRNCDVIYEVCDGKIEERDKKSIIV